MGIIFIIQLGQDDQSVWSEAKAKIRVGTEEAFREMSGGKVGVGIK